MAAAAAATGVPRRVLSKLKKTGHPAFDGSTRIRFEFVKREEVQSLEEADEDPKLKLEINLLSEKVRRARHENKVREGAFIRVEDHRNYNIQVAGRVRSGLIQWVKTEWAPRLLGLSVPEMIELMTSDANRLIDSLVHDIESHVTPPC